MDNVSSIPFVPRSSETIKMFPEIAPTLDFKDKRRARRCSEISGILLVDDKYASVLIDISEFGVACTWRSFREPPEEVQVEIVLPVHEMCLSNILCRKVGYTSFSSCFSNNFCTHGRLSLEFADVSPQALARLCGLIDSC